MRRVSGYISLVVGFGLVVAACGQVPEAVEAPSPSTSATTQSNLGGDGLPVQNPGEDYGHFPRPLTGLLELDSKGCWTVDLGDQPRLVVFPSGYSRGDDGASMIGPNGDVFTSGVDVDVLGGIVAVEGFPGTPDGFWGGYFEFCSSTSPEVVVVDHLAAGFEVDALSPEQLANMLRGADFNTSWGCGLGFTISTADQRVALYLNPTDYDAVPVSPVSFASVDWEAEVVIGKNLLANHCDDVVEGWEPQPEVAATWALMSGTLDFEAPSGEPCGSGSPVIATLVDALVDTPQSPVELGDLTIVNDAYGCFAG